MIGTRYKFRHYGPVSDRPGVSRLLWASDGPRRDLYVAGPADEILRGSPADLELAADQLWTPNALADEGELDILDVYFKNQAVRASLFFRLYGDGAIADTDTLATLTNEVSGSGYAAITVTRDTDWSEPALDAGDGRTVTGTKSFIATGGWTAATELVLATVGTGTAGLHIAWAALSQSRTLNNGEQLDVTLAVKLN